MNERKKATIMFASSVVLLCLVYIPTIQWMFDRWFAHESYYGHGFLIPIVSLYIAWQRKNAIQKAKWSNNPSGIMLIFVGLIIHILSAALRIYFISGFSMIA